MRKPRALREGSTIGIVAPASNVDRNALLRGIDALEKLGYRVRYSEQVFMQDYYFAGAHDLRARELMRMFVDPQIEAILCARGGYGCVHLLSRLDSEVFRANPKVFLGHSDVTVLLQYMEYNVVISYQVNRSGIFRIGKLSSEGLPYGLIYKRNQYGNVFPFYDLFLPVIFEKNINILHGVMKQVAKSGWVYFVRNTI